MDAIGGMVAKDSKAKREAKQKEERGLMVGMTIVFSTVP